jgi:hypothetical protein
VAAGFGGQPRIARTSPPVRQVAQSNWRLITQASHYSKSLSFLAFLFSG